MSKDTGYTRDEPIRIVRIKHRIAFTTDANPSDLIKLLGQVPNRSTFDDVAYESDLTMLVFHEEYKE